MFKNILDIPAHVIKSLYFKRKQAFSGFLTFDCQNSVHHDGYKKKKKFCNILKQGRVLLSFPVLCIWVFARQSERE